MNIEKVDLVLLQDEEDDIFYVEPAPYKEDPDDLLIPLSEEEETFTATSRMPLQELFYDYIWGIMADDEKESQENLAEFKEQILNLIDIAFQENKENYIEESERIKMIESLVSEDKTE